MNIAEKGSWTGDWLSHVKVSNGEFYFAFAASTFSPVNADDSMRTLPKDQWIHLMTWDGERRKLYVNGVLDEEDHPVGSLRPNSSPIEIGERSGGTYMFKGQMDEFKLFNRALGDAGCKAEQRARCQRNHAVQRRERARYDVVRHCESRRCH